MEQTDRATQGETPQGVPCVWRAARLHLAPGRRGLPSTAQGGAGSVCPPRRDPLPLIPFLRLAWMHPILVPGDVHLPREGRSPADRCSTLFREPLRWLHRQRETGFGLARAGGAEDGVPTGTRSIRRQATLPKLDEVAVVRAIVDRYTKGRLGLKSACPLPGSQGSRRGQGAGSCAARTVRAPWNPVWHRSTPASPIAPVPARRMRRGLDLPDTHPSRGRSGSSCRGACRSPRLSCDPMAASTAAHRSRAHRAVDPATGRPRSRRPRRRKT